VLLVYGNLGALTERFAFPIESNASKLVVFVAAQRKDLISLIDPDGVVQRAGESVSVQSYQHMSIVNVQKPKAGKWSVEVAGGGRVVVHASINPDATSPIELIDFAFVERGGRPGHEGLFPVKSEPRAGATALARVSLGGAPRGAIVGFVTLSGQAIGSDVPLSLDDGEALVEVTVPRGTYRVRVRGTDASGRSFQREESRSRGE
jgi:hypothetical protein